MLRREVVCDIGAVILQAELIIAEVKDAYLRGLRA